MTEIERALALGAGEIVSLVGAGGKTTLMFALGRKLSASRSGVVLTTTTKIWNPAPSPLFTLLFAEGPSAVRRLVRENINRSPCLLIARCKSANGKLEGIPPAWVGEIRAAEGVSTVVIEADGAAGRPLKAPRDGEPVWAPLTTTAIPVVGIDALGAPLDEEHVFRSKIAVQILDQPAGTAVTEDTIVRLVAETLKTRPGGSRVIPFINKVDLPSGLENGRRVARSLLNSQTIQADRVILSQAQSEDMIREIFEKGVGGRG